MTVFVHSIVIICFKFLFVDRLGSISTLKGVASVLMIADLGPIYTSCCCGAEPIIIMSGIRTAFSMFDSFDKPNWSNLIPNWVKTITYT